jgi:Outer membrane protein beta-barrel domain
MPAQHVGGGILATGIGSQIDGDSWGGYNKLGYALGGFAWYDVTDHLSVMPEISFGKRGSREVVLGYEQYSLTFLDVPWLVRYRVSGSPAGGHLLAEAGPSVNVLLAAKSGFGPQKLDLLPQFHRWNVSGSVGATAFFNPFIGAFLRWTYSLTNMNRNWMLTRQYWRCRFISVGIKLAFK